MTPLNIRRSIAGCFAASLLLTAGQSANALEIIKEFDFEEGTAGSIIQADTVDEASTQLPGFPSAVARYSNAQTRPGGGSLSMLLQDGLFTNAANSPQVFWNLNDGAPLDSTRTIKLSYWKYVANTVQLGGSGDAFQTDARQDVMLTGSDADRFRPEGNQGYLAQTWNWQGGPTASDPDTVELFGDVDTGVFTQPLATFSTGEWVRVENYIPLAHMFDGSPLFQGLPDVDDLDNDGDTTEFRGYIDLTGRNYDDNPDNDRPDDTAVFYSRVMNGSLDTVYGMSPYMFRRPSDHTVAGEPGATDPELRVRALQILDLGSDNSATFFDDITIGYITTDDIDDVISAIASGSTSAELDYNADGIVDGNDSTYFIQTVLQTAPGDANFDRRVNGLDVSAVVGNFGGTGDWVEGDFNGDGVIDGFDVSAVVGNFGFQLDGIGGAPASSATQAVPEPTTVALFGIVGALFAARRRRPAIA